MNDRSMLPPRKRDWKPGSYQVGGFIRTRDGATLTMVNDTAGVDLVRFALLLISEGKIETKTLTKEDFASIREKASRLDRLMADGISDLIDGEARKDYGQEALKFARELLLMLGKPL